MFTIEEIADVRRLRRSGALMRIICERHDGHSRDEIVEAIDATIRCDTNHSATEHVNHVLEAQANGIPFINGREAILVMWGF
jgi:hypothetical protein